ncbi:MAG: hypothetical protein MK312_09530 [Roseibacillus sp.]|nr:hypothetical protein [Roseibacillus sp.]
MLIAPAGFGDGHNTAARGFAMALDGQAESLFIDPSAEATPRFNNFLRKTYRFITTYLPRTWEWIYDSVEQRDFSQQKFPFRRKLQQAFALQVNTFNPDIIVSTFPLYPYFFEHYVKDGGRPRPVITIVTDSIEINASWRKAPTDFWLVTDEETRKAMVAKNIRESEVVNTGFPVNPLLATIDPLSSTAPATPFRILYFPTPSKSEMRKTARAVLEERPWPTELTFVLGRNVRRLYRSASEIRERYPGRVLIKGWTRKVPQLLCEHHLVIGKAGGATVHESLAACCPMLIRHLVPGQEEGNLELLSNLGGGSLTHNEATLSRALDEMLTDQATKWRQQKESLSLYSRPDAARDAATFILKTARRNLRSSTEG